MTSGHLIASAVGLGLSLWALKYLVIYVELFDEVENIEENKEEEKENKVIGIKKKD